MKNGGSLLEMVTFGCREGSAQLPFGSDDGPLCGDEAGGFHGITEIVG